MDVICRAGEQTDSWIIEWAIDRFSSATGGVALKSSTFSSKMNDDLKWCLMLYKRGLNETNIPFLLLKLKLVSDCRNSVSTAFIFSILNANGEKSHEAGIYHKFLGGDEVGNRLFITLSNLYGTEKQLLLPNDKLTIICEMTIFTRSIKALNDCIQIQVPDCSLLNDLEEQLLKDQHLSDVILCTASKEYKAHKAILAARSPVFAAMFRHEMEENKSNRVDISDVDEEVLEEVLNYIYTGKAPNLDKMADKLLIVADKYDMKRLEALCEMSLCDNLAVCNAADALIIADLHGAEVLKKRAIVFINRNLKEITKTAGWEKLLFLHHLVTQVCGVSV